MSVDAEEWKARAKMAGFLYDRLVSETADLVVRAAYWRFFSALEIPFPGNGDRRRRSLGSNEELRRGKAKHGARLLVS